ncbi:hypothetical protein [Halogranum rubrum]|uniref:Uncharacterized protein n=1 Tax=Halogranum salarium B-1 TaxID=1210908 RepID=J3JDY5_9EURY|nr:hypothetical protein [Halogranum salarium]EJN57894.1 hypothetical protein HSB1_33110 [Halogranum salarium B-1]
MPDGYNYTASCKHCGVRPFSEGPQHDDNCVRNSPSLETQSELALSKVCRYCRVRPYLAGPHHDTDCFRFFDVTSTDESVDDIDREEASTETEERETSGKNEENDEVTPDNLLDAFDAAAVPLLTAEEVAESAGCSESAASDGLERLVDRGDLYRKKVGAGVVFLLVGEIPDS